MSIKSMQGKLYYCYLKVGSINDTPSIEMLSQTMLSCWLTLAERAVFLDQ